MLLQYYVVRVLCYYATMLLQYYVIRVLCCYVTMLLQYYVWGRKINCVMRRFFPSSSVGDRPAPRGCTSTPDERKVTTI